MKPKLKLLLLIMVFLAGCQWLGQRREFSYPQPVINVSIQEEQISEIDTNKIEVNSESEIVSSPVDSTMNQAVDLFQLQMNEKQLAAIIYEPSLEQLSILNDLEVVKYYQIPNDERLLIIPKNIGSKISIYEVMYKNDELIETRILLESQFIEDQIKTVVQTTSFPFPANVETQISGRIHGFEDIFGSSKTISSVQLLSHVRLFVTPWTAAY